MKRLLSRFASAVIVAGWTLLFGVLPLYAQTAALLPNGVQQFVDQNGAPLAGGSVYFYVPNTTTFKTTWLDPNEASANTNPVVLNAAGQAVIYGQGSYQETVKDAAGNQQWSALTTATGAASPSGATGSDTAPVGTILPWSGFNFNVPTNWMLAYGEALSRTTYAQLMTAITISTTTGSCTASSTTVGGFSDTSQIPIGAAIEASCLPTGDTVASIVNGTTITVTSAATATSAATVTVFPWGDGDGASTFNVPDLRGRVLPGPDAMGGTPAGRIYSSVTGGTIAGTMSGYAVNDTITLAATGGTQVTAAVLTVTGVSSGAVTTFTVTTAGKFAVSPTAFTQASTSGSGTGFQLTSPTFFTPYGTAAAAPAEAGGVQNQNKTFMLAQNQLPNIVPTFTGNSLNEIVNNGTYALLTVNSGTGYVLGSTSPGVGQVSSYSTSLGTPASVTGTPSGTISSINGNVTQQSIPLDIPTVQPSLTIDYIIKVAPNTTGAGGVVSANGLFGDVLWLAGSGLSVATASPNITYACNVASSSVHGCVQVDGTTITASGGVISAVGTSQGITVGTTTVSGGPGLLYNTSSGGTLTALGAVNSAVVSYSSGGTLQASTTLPSGLAATNLSLTTPTLGVASGTSLALGGATIGGNTLAVTGNTLLNSALTYGGVTLNNSVTGTGSMVLSSSPSLTSPTITNSLTATGLVTYADMASAALATSSQYIAGTSSTLVPSNVAYTAETTTTYGATTTFDFSTFINTAVTLTGNITTMSVANVKAGQAGQIRFIQDATGSRTTVWNSVFKFAGGVTPTLSTGANDVDVLFYSCVSTSLCYASLSQNMK